MRRSHIASHTPSPAKIRPLGQHFLNFIRMILPLKSRWAVGPLFQDRRLIKSDFDRLVNKMERKGIHKKNTTTRRVERAGVFHSAE
jgi:hypothetical protein